MIENTWMMLTILGFFTIAFLIWEGVAKLKEIYKMLFDIRYYVEEASFLEKKARATPFNSQYHIEGTGFVGSACKIFKKGEVDSICSCDTYDDAVKVLNALNRSQT